MEPRYRLRFKPFLSEGWSLLQETYYKWSQANAPVLGAALAFYTIFSLAPVFIIVVAVVGFIVGKESVQIYIVGQLAQFVGQHNAESVMQVIQNSYKMGSGIKATIIACILILVGSTTAFVMLKNALDTIWGVKGNHGGVGHLVKSRLVSLLVVLFVGLVIFLSMLLSSVVSALQLFLDDYINIPYALISLANDAVSLVMLAFLFAMLFKILPDVKISWGDVWMGGAITALLFGLGRYLLGLYLARSSISSAYGAAGSLVVFLLWVYYSAQILFFGAAFTQVFASKFGSEIIPKEPRH
ncbi:MAG: YihY/virulence factor BrkB family protein [Syntrophales bacterium]|nr:YihY/virulence factor BrkB family protein [Syntrophales bacterium]MDD5641120.1 YihY/virulence factor BrkB family protein [Syntrophales bacterium]